MEARLLEEGDLEHALVIMVDKWVKTLVGGLISKDENPTLRYSQEDILVVESEVPFEKSLDFVFDRLIFVP